MAAGRTPVRASPCIRKTAICARVTGLSRQYVAAAAADRDAAAHDGLDEVVERIVRGQVEEVDEQTVPSDAEGAIRFHDANLIQRARRKNRRPHLHVRLVEKVRGSVESADRHGGAVGEAESDQVGDDLKGLARPKSARSSAPPARCGRSGRCVVSVNHR